MRALSLLLVFLATQVIGSFPVRADDPAELRIGISSIGLGGRPFTSGSALAVAHVQGLVEKEFAGTKTEIKWVFHKGAGPEVTEGLATGHLDIVTQGDLPSLTARAGGLKTHLILGAHGSPGRVYLAVATDSSINGIADLRGKTVAVFRGTAGELQAARLLASAGLRETDVKVVNLETPAIVPALLTHQIDATFTTLGSLPIRNRGLIRYAYSTDGRPEKVASASGIFVRDDFAAKYPDAVDRFTRAVVAAAAWASKPENREAVFELWSKSGYDADIFRQGYEGIDLAYALNPLLDDYVIGRYQAAADDAFQLGLMRKPVSVNGWADRKPLDAALAALNLEHFWPSYNAEGTAEPSQ